MPGPDILRPGAPPASQRLTPDHVATLAEDIRTICRLDSVIEYLNESRGSEGASAAFGRRLTDYLGITPDTPACTPLAIGRDALDALIAGRAAARAEIEARVIPYVDLDAITRAREETAARSTPYVAGSA